MRITCLLWLRSCYCGAKWNRSHLRRQSVPPPSYWTELASALIF